ncbi:hypothetical protein ABOM_006553 [Aspergillus bombycis]|uniref:BZIP domain-containing protein n=1 Tax=Aspergillus bombycis TaxID=109264 RepID=A0A1F7ZYN1_9EURO|nr:hypothetical protein ABOM_006553 [Aspergillus bombycis]OGM44561.1 hypothetical protein ABOM_006553 [Aspergillus bombycis]
MDNTNQKKLDKLARVRENQRKSRARKQEHIRGLEQKLVALQEQVHKKDVEHRLAVQKLEAENRSLKLLFSRLGLPTEIIAEYVQAVEDPNMAQKVAIPALRQSPATQNQRNNCGSPPSLPRCQAGSEVPHIVELGSSSKTDVLQGAARSAQKAKPQEISDQQVSNQRQSIICGCLPDEAAGSRPTSYDVLNTTLCAIAEELIKQHNRRGLDMAEIQKKLWAGFSNGLTTDEGCRVQNQILFQVLDEISGD